MILKGKTAVVTGGTRGIGRAVAEALYGQGADVSICALHPAEIERAIAEIGAIQGGRIMGRPCDVRRHDQVKTYIQQTADTFGGIDILVNNAGVAILGSTEELSPASWCEVIDTNLTGCFYCCHEVIPYMKKRGGGYIVNMASRSGKNAFAGGAAYNASKFGLVGFSEALMLDVRNDRIRVSYVMPGRVSTDLAGEEKEDWQLQPTDIAKVVVDLLTHDNRAVATRVEIRPAIQPPFR